MMRDTDPLAHQWKQVEAFLQEKVREAKELHITNFHRIPGGSSKEMLAFDVSWMEGNRPVAHSWLVRRELPAGVLETKCEDEFRVMDALWETGVPVPKMLWLETDPKWLDTPFFIEEKVDGDSSRDAYFSDPQRKRAIGRHFVECLAKQHLLDWHALGLAFLGVPKDAADCAERLIDHWEETLERHKVEPTPLLAEGLKWLRRNKPPEVQCVSLIHGDPGPGNFIVRGDRVVAIHDWEMAHLGDPMDDVGWCSWRARDLLLWEEFVEVYEAHSGLKVIPESVRYYEIFTYARCAIATTSGLRSFCLGINQQMNMASVGTGLHRQLLDGMARLIGF